MPSLPIPLGVSQDSSIEEMGGAAPLSANVLADAGGSVRRRPGISSWSDFPAPSTTSPVIGMAVYGDALVYVTQDRKIHAWLASGLVQELSDATAATQLDGGTRPTFAITQERITIAGGGALQTWQGTGLSTRLGGSPPAATHVVGANTRLIVNVRDNSGRVQWSDPGIGGHESWPALNFLELESRPDPLPALYSDTNELVGIGSQSVQYLVADAVAGFVSSRTVSSGTVAPYSFCQSDEVSRFMDDRKRIVESDGRSITPVSSPAITKTLRDLDAVSDTWAFHAHIGAYNLAVWVMPTAGRSFAYNVESKTWSEWRARTSNGLWFPLGFSSYCYFPQHDLHLVGMADGRIMKLDMDATTDDGDLLYGEMVSGFLDRGSGRLKLCEAVKLTFRHTPGTSPRVSLSWRDDTGAYGNPIDFTVTSSGMLEIRSLGTYRQREYRLTMSDDAPLTLVAATEDYQMLEV